MRTLILPDLHLKHLIAQRIVDRENPDKIIFLGDFYDNFHDTPEMNVETAKWDKQMINDPRVTRILGNHDCHYRFNNKPMRCSGYDWQKDTAINNVLTYEDWDKCVWFTFCDGWLLTHAGLSQSLINSHAKSRDLHDWLIVESKQATHSARTYIGKHWFYEAGRCRGGDAKVGGLVWCDLREFRSTPSINQIFGHTPNDEPLWEHQHGKWIKDDDKYGPNRTGNLALDTHMQHYAIIDDGSVEINETRIDQP